ncbi:hypothetical protein GJAV_G00169000 [Gymnothorax javanicus]|nr:hypothetical protein GJAV_G00169000 [Gymnothorax javanicus]
MGTSGDQSPCGGRACGSHYRAVGCTHPKRKTYVCNFREPMAAAGSVVDDESPSAPAAAAWEAEDGTSVVAVQLERSRPYGCTLCSKRFLSKSHFTEHQRVHTGERPYPCQQCERSFTTLHNLKRHQTIHAKEASYRCRKCGVLFCHVHKNAAVHRSLSPDAPAQGLGKNSARQSQRGCPGALVLPEASPFNAPLSLQEEGQSEPFAIQTGFTCAAEGCGAWGRHLPQEGRSAE